jgi:hypothetical protein
MKLTGAGQIKAHGHHARWRTVAFYRCNFKTLFNTVTRREPPKRFDLLEPAASMASTLNGQSTFDIEGVSVRCDSEGSSQSKLVYFLRAGLTTKASPAFFYRGPFLAMLPLARDRCAQWLSTLLRELHPQERRTMSSTGSTMCLPTALRCFSAKPAKSKSAATRPSSFTGCWTTVIVG